MDTAVLQVNQPLEPYLARILQEQFPEWQPTLGTCPRCILRAAHAARERRSHDSLHHELLLPYPVYSRDETALLPTPYRVHAFPHFTGRGVTLAFLDSGFYPHSDLTRPYNRILAHIDATLRAPVERERFARPLVSSWHGMMTACVAAGNGFMSDSRYRGIASDARLVLVKTGNRRGRRIHEADIYRALEWVILNQNRYNIRIVNISLGGDIPSTGESTPLDELVEEAVARGMVVIAAAGNGGMECIIPPASAPSAITVGGLDDQNSTDRARHRMYHSNYGRGVLNCDKPELLAPAIWLAAPMLPHTRVHNEGQYLWKLIHAPDAELARLLESKMAAARFRKETLALPPDQIRRAIRHRMIEQKYIHAHYQHVDGTSMAAPVVSSVVAQMLEANPSLAPAQVKAILIATADPLSGYPRVQQGYGVINPPRAVALALRAHGGPMPGFPLSPLIDRDTVSFSYYDADARRVRLVGDWSEWRPHDHEFREHPPGVWTITIPRPPPGVYPYKFLVERIEHQRPTARWLGDSENGERIEDGSGGFYSLLEIN